MNIVTWLIGLRRRNKFAILLGMDGLAALIALALSMGMIGALGLPGVDIGFKALPIIAGTSFLTVFFGYRLGLHEIKLKYFALYGMGRSGMVAAGVALCFFVAARGFGLPFPDGFFVLYGLALYVLLVAQRFVALELLYTLYKMARTHRPVAIYGAGATGARLAADLKRHDKFVPVAFIDEDQGRVGSIAARLPIISPAQIEALVADHGVTTVFLAIPSLSATKATLISRRLRGYGLNVRSVPLLKEMQGDFTDLSVSNLNDPEVFVDRGRLGGAYRASLSDFDGKRALVTGAGGSIGSELCRQLIAGGVSHLTMFDQNEYALYQLDQELSDLIKVRGCKVTRVLGSVCDAALVRRVIAERSPQIIYHAAAYKHVPLVEENIVSGVSNNVLGTRIVAQIALELGVEQFVLVSSDKAVRPANVMGASKRMAELVVQDLATRSKTCRFSMVRFGNVLGSSGSVIPLFERQIQRGGPVTLTHPDMTRYFMSVPEAVTLVMLAGTYAKGGDVFVLDMGEPVRIRDLADQMIRAAGYSVRDAANPEGDIEIRITGIRPGEKLYEELLIGEGRVTTPHPKIMRAQEDYLSEIEVANMLRELQAAAATQDEATVRQLLLQRVVGYGVQAERNPQGAVLTGPAE
ncbi:UDP-N-acetyl-alpha-D-glucosamine C6 dehydratase [Aquimixticola soesokkakensis]|uniref:UDP-N-acetyl-alpha-D-glucosamine C6 dehydratase n=1 Tax=Aquimixticola soesokkakensis TaxID=1519096 RepID=A0A1Y5R651_9RHOB|nr:nucleoside-diphosphate sugar epimerase/dehydratase [Aquimixticola soesokkakensis]SLN10048.1 UDP-N-acetyl-alpha-D-glucosamine C6 dehydratase [Aquimixticola soesokkakensis]